MNKLIAFFFISILPILCYCQESSEHQKHSIIEVIGFAEKKVVPNEIYITLNLYEYYRGRKLISIAQQEKQLIDSLQKYDIPKSSIRSNKTTAKYTKVKPLKKGTIATATYSIIGKNTKDIRICI